MGMLQQVALAETTTDVVAGPCETVSQTGTMLELIDFGVIYSEDFKFNSREDRLDLYDGVCIKRETGDIWQLEAQSMVIQNASSELELFAEFVNFQFDGWKLTSDSLISNKDFFQFQAVDLAKDNMQITAVDLKFNLTTNKFVLTDVNALYRNEFQISGKTMNIGPEKVVFSDAYVTTCMCEEQHLYDVKSPSIVYDLDDSTLTLSQADLAIFDSKISLGENYVIDNKIDLQFPTLFVDYSDGLEIALRNIVLSKGVSVDVGAQGIDAEHEFNPYALLKLGLTEQNSPGLGGKLKGTLGKAVSGLQGDLSYERELVEGFSLDIGTRNHDWAAAEYLNDGFVGLSYSALPVSNPPKAESLKVVSRVFAAITRQEINKENLIGPRVGLSVSNNYTNGIPKKGLFKFSVVPEATYYPTENAFQYAVTLVPSFRYQADGFSFSTTYTHKFTNAASPFTTDADKASEASNLKVSLGFQELSPNGDSFGLSTNTLVDFLKNSEANQSLIRKVGVNLNSTIKGLEGSKTEFKPYFAAELARVITGIEDASLDDSYAEDFLQFGMDSFYDDWELGLRARLNPTVKEEEQFVEVLEVGLGLPLRQGEFLLKPYIGLNFASLVTELDTFEISTYGVSASYDCCGDANAFFQVRDGNLTTGLKLPF